MTDLWPDINWFTLKYCSRYRV